MDPNLDHIPDYHREEFNKYVEYMNSLGYEYVTYGDFLFDTGKTGSFLGMMNTKEDTFRLCKRNFYKKRGSRYNKSKSCRTVMFVSTKFKFEIKD